MKAFSMSENNNKRLLGFVVSPVVLIRLSSILVVVLMAGHLSAYPWTSTHGLQEPQLVDSMKSVEFEFLGERSTYWSLYFGWGLLIGVLLLLLAIIQGREGASTCIAESAGAGSNTDHFIGDWGKASHHPARCRNRGAYGRRDLPEELGDRDRRGFRHGSERFVRMDPCATSAH